MKRFFLFFALIPFFLCAQVTDDFGDGDFTQNPAWTGSIQKFKVNDNFQLQLNDTAAGSAWLSTPAALMSRTEWRFWLSMPYSPSANNYSRFYLMSDQEDLSSDLNGYFLQLGESGSTDAIELFRQSGDALQGVCRGTDGLIATSFSLRIKVVRDGNGKWMVYADPSGGENFQLEAEGTDTVHKSTSAIGLSCTYTKSNSSRCYFDELYMGTEIIDSLAPEMVSLTTSSDSSLLLQFDEAVDAVSATNTSNYWLEPSLIHPKNVTLMPDDPTSLALLFSAPFVNGTDYTLSASGIQDLSGNIMTLQSLDFSYYQPQAFDVVINEIMADPSPPAGLPNAEYVELKNQTARLIDLTGWTFTIGSSEKSFEQIQLQADGYLILAHEADQEMLTVYGPVYGFESFSLTNTGQTLELKDATAQRISSISYEDSWYGDPGKTDGGWALEQINPANICSAADNWKASVHPSGGTPGRENSVYSNQVIRPRLAYFEVLGDSLIRLYFTQAMDLLSVADPQHYLISPSDGSSLQLVFDDDHPNQVMLLTENPFVSGQIYELTISKLLTNCMDIPLAGDTLIAFGLEAPATPNDLIINEVLFNPLADGVDYVEVYNRSENTLNLQDLQIGTVKTSPPDLSDTSYYTLSEKQFLLIPDAYMVLTSEPERVKKQYVTLNPSGFLRVMPFPSYNNDKGCVILATREGALIDVFEYNEDMHYPLLNYVEGVSLERTHADTPTQLVGNWHSAAESVGFGTPAYQNSQMIATDQGGDDIRVEPEIFSPDNDGYHDLISIKYNFDQAGYVMHVSIYNASGQLIRNLVNNEYLGTSGLVNWDGLMDDHHKAEIGIYVFFIEVYDTEGHVKQYKRTGVLAGKL